jgi:hypothetical protein
MTGFPSFSPLGAIDSTDKVIEGTRSERKTTNYDMKYGTDYELDKKEIEPPEEDYEVTDNQKSPERNFGQPGIRLYHNEHDSFAEVGQPASEDILAPEDDTPVAVDDAKKHGSKNKYKFGGDEGKRSPDYDAHIK